MASESVAVERPSITIEPSRGLADLRLDEVWAYRELLFFLVWRDLKARYRQTVLGAFWIVLQPLVSMLVFSFLFGNLLQVPSGDVPYPIFNYAALLPWNYFASSLRRTATGVVNSRALITKVYFPRLVIPISGVLSGLVDFGIAFLVLIGLMVYFGIAPTAAVALLPAFVALTALTALGVGLWLSALNVRYRDVQHIVPYLIQVWMYVTPVVYGSTLIPPRFRFLLGLNPMTGVVEGFRWALLGNRLTDAQAPESLFVISIGIALIVLVSGLFFFRHTERSFADVI